MAEVHIVDIDGEQWDIKDSPLTARVAALEEAVSTKDLQNIELNMKPDYTAVISTIYNHYSVGKIHFMSIRLQHLAGNNIGTSSTALFGSINIRPKKDTVFILYDYANNAILRCYINTNGEIAAGESIGVVPGNNIILGEIIFAEP